MNRFIPFFCILMAALSYNTGVAQTLANGGFETWTTVGGGAAPGNWTIAGAQGGTIAANTALFNEGAKSCRISATMGSYSISQVVYNITPGKTYTFRVSYYIETASGNGRDARINCYFRNGSNAGIAMTKEDSVALIGPGGSATTGSFTTTTGSWKTYTYDVVAPANSTNFYFSITVARGAIVSWDNCYFAENTTPTIYKYTYSTSAGYNYSPSLSGFTYSPGAGPSADQSFTFKANALTANLVITVPTNYEISPLSGSSFVSLGNSYSVSPSSGSVSATTLYVRLKSGLSVGAYSGNVSFTSTGATTQTIPLSGSVVAPGVTLSTTSLSSISYGYSAGPSPAKTFTVSGSSLTGTLYVIAPSDYEISQDGSSYGSAVGIVPSGGTVGTTTIYLRLKAGLGIGAYNESVTVSTTGYTAQSITLTGNVWPTTSVESEEIAPVLKVNASGVVVRDMKAGQLVKVYNTVGLLLKSVKSGGDEVKLELTPGNVYLVLIDRKTFKVIL